MRFAQVAFLVLATTLPTYLFAESTIDFAKDIQPIFKASCYSCHGEDKGLGRLRLHNAEAIADATKVHDDLLLAGKPEESELYERLVLPADDKKRMPKGADPLAEKEIELIKKWIEEGAEYTSTDVPGGKEPAEKEQSPAETPKERPELSPATTDALNAAKQTGALVVPLYAGSNELRVSFPSSRDQVTDQTVVALEPLAGQLVSLDLSGTSVTDGVSASLAKFTNLDTLHLENTAVGDAAVAALDDMPYLEYLNLHSTKVTDASLKSLESATSLQKLYLWQTAVSYKAAQAIQKQHKGLEVNLGWNHPGVVLARLKSEIARTEEQKATAVKAAEEAKQTLTKAEADQKAADEQLGELKKQLEQLDKPAEETPAEGEAPNA